MEPLQVNLITNVQCVISRCTVKLQSTQFEYAASHQH